MAMIITLIFEFGKIGLFAVGGGLAALPFLYELTTKYDWFNSAMLTDMVAISESTPGPIGVNMATYAGFETAGILGGIIATIAMILPAFIIVMIVANILDKFKTNKTVVSIFYGLRPAVTAMIASACIGVARVALFHNGNPVLSSINWLAIALTAVIAYLLLKFNKHPAFYIAGAAVVGILLKM